MELCIYIYWVQFLGLIVYEIAWIVLTTAEIFLHFMSLIFHVHGSYMIYFTDSVISDGEFSQRKIVIFVGTLLIANQKRFKSTHRTIYTSLDTSFSLDLDAINTWIVEN